MCVTKVEGCGICHKYPNIQTDSLKYYKHFAKIVLQVTFTHKEFIWRVKGVCLGIFRSLLFIVPYS